MTTESTPAKVRFSDQLGRVDETHPLRPLCYMEPELVRKLKAKNPTTAKNYGATTTVTIVPAFADDAPLYDQAALDAAVAAERERLLSMPRLMHACDALGAPADGEHCDVLRQALLGA